jgi:erythrocyte band 7 integral membrane protein
MASVSSARNSVVSLASSSSPMAQTGSSHRHHHQIIETKLLEDEGIGLPSSSSKDEDILSESSNEIETIARETLEKIHEDPPKSFDSPSSKKTKTSSSDISNYTNDPGKVGKIRSDKKSQGIINIEAQDGNNNDDSKKSSKRGQNSGKNKRLNEDEEGDRDEANIQNEFGICGWILTILSYILVFFTMPFSLCMTIKVVQEYERAVIFRLGRLMPGGAKGPGIFFIVPCIDSYRKVDLRVLSFEVPPQEILSKDSVTVAVDAVVYFRISNATISVTNVEDCSRSTKLLAQTTLRNILGTKTLAEMLSDREAISLQMQSTLDEATEPWGVKVERVEVKDVRLPVQLQRAMAAEAEATREARAKVIVAEGEQKASRALKEAAEVIAESPSALQLRYLQTLNSISAEKNSTIIFPFPIDLLSSFLHRPTPKIHDQPGHSTSSMKPHAH